MSDLKKCVCFHLENTDKYLQLVPYWCSMKTALSYPDYLQTDTQTWKGNILYKPMANAWHLHPGFDSRYKLVFTL